METAETLQRVYGTRFADTAEYRDRVWKVLIRDFFRRWISPNATVLDLGAGYGEFINNVTCAKKYALDLNPDTQQKVHSDIEVFSQDASQTWPLPGASLDVVFTSNFFEHVPDKTILENVLREVSRCLVPGGTLIAMGPNIKYTGGSYWDFWDHHLPLTEQSLAEILLHTGLDVELNIAQFLPYTMVGGPEYPPFFVALYLRLPFVWRIFGKQFVVIARKRS